MTIARPTTSDANGPRGAFMRGALTQSLGLTQEDLDCVAVVAINTLKRGAVKDALALFTTLVFCDPHRAGFLAGVSHCAYLRQAYDLSLRSAAAVIALEPSKARGYFLSGRACLALGHLQEAAEDLRDAVEFARRQRDHTLLSAAENLLRKVPAQKHS